MTHEDTAQKPAVCSNYAIELTIENDCLLCLPGKSLTRMSPKPEHRYRLIILEKVFQWFRQHKTIV